MATVDIHNPSSPERARSFVLTKGRSQRFCHVYVSRSFALVVSEGKTGPGEVRSQQFDSEANALKACDQLVEEKLAEGFVETTDVPWHGGYESELRTKLEQAIFEDPEDVAAHSAYADHLMELGDPRGEFIQVQLALEDESLTVDKRKKLRQREKRLLEKNERAWLGPMSNYWIDKFDAKNYSYPTSRTPHQLTWRRGWIDSLWLHDAEEESGLTVPSREPLLRCLRDFRLLRAEPSHAYAMLTLLKLDIFRHVRTFQEGENGDQCYSESEGWATQVIHLMPQLEEHHSYVRIYADWIFTQTYPDTLRKLSAHHSWGHYPLKKLVENETLHHLTHLSCWPCSQMNYREDIPNDDGGFAYISRSGAVSLFRSGKFKDLQHLTLRNSDIGDEGIRHLVESGMLEQLKTLDLRGGCITDEGAKLIAECSASQNLEMLNLNENMIGGSGIAALRRAGVKISVDSQLGPEAFEDREYLFSGDCE